MTDAIGPPLWGAFVNRPVVEELGTAKRAGIASLTEGQRVAFDIALGGRGRRQPVCA